jgi:hypothetical protein
VVRPPSGGPLKPGGEIARLIADLRDGDAVAREAASARLRIIGARALTQLAALVHDERNAAVRVAALATIEGIDHAHIADIAIDALADSDVDVRTAAIPVLRAWMSREPGTRVLEALTGVALDRAQPTTVRLAALDALSDLPRDIVQPILERAPDSSAMAVRDANRRTALFGRAAMRPDTAKADAGPPAFTDPQTAREWIGAHDDASLSVLHDIVVTAREHERTDAATARQRDWMVVRGGVHALLARRRSRVALYDLREAFDAARSPLPLDFLTAIAAIGDGTCLEPLARAWAATSTETWWRERLSEAAADIMHREQITPRSALMKRLRAKWPEFLRH